MIAEFLVGSFAGWLVERVANAEPRYSRYAFGLPLLPVYGAGLVALSAVSKAVSGSSLPARAGVYALTATSVELGACLVDRALGGGSWSYAEDGQKGLCVSTKHTVAWTALALVAEPWLR